MEGKNKNAVRELLMNTIIFGVSTIGTKLIMFFLLPIYTKYLTAEELGTAELVVNLMNFLFPIISLNILSALLRFALDNSVNKEKALQMTAVLLTASLLVSGIFLYFIHMEASLEPWKGYLWLLLFSYAAAQVALVYLKATDKTILFAIGNIIYTSGVFVLSIVLLIWFKRGTAGYLEAIIIANVITFFICTIRGKVLKLFCVHKPDWILLKHMVCFSFPLIFNSISHWIAHMCDRFVLAFYFGTYEVGLYSVAAKIPALVSTVSSLFLQAWGLSAIKEYENSKNVDFFNFVYRKFSAVFLIWTSIIIGICQPIIFVLTQGEFKDSWRYVPFLLCAAMFTGIGGFFCAIYTSAKKNVAVMITTVLGAVVNLTLNLLFIPKYGIYGAVTATMLSELLIMTVRMIGSRRFINFDIDVVRMTAAVVLLLGECLAVLAQLWGIVLVLCIIICFLYGKEIQEIMFAGVDFLKCKKKKN